MADPLDVTLQENVIPNETPAKPEPMSVTLDKALASEEPTEFARQESDTRPPRADGRKADGTFAPKESSKLTEAPAPVPLAAKAPLPETKAPAPAPGDVPAPASWGPDLQAEWGKLPAPVKQHMVKREGELQQGFQQIHQRVEISKAILQEFVPYADILEKEGATPQVAIRTLLQTAKALRDGGPEYKKAILFSLAQQYGVDISQPLNQELAKAQAEAGTLQIDRMYQMSGQMSQQQQEVQRQLGAFAADPANEFFQQVSPIMGKMLELNAVTNLKDAYNTAIWMHPEVRKTLLGREAARATEAAQRSSAANLSVTGAPGGPAMVNAKDSKRGLRDTIEAAFGTTDQGRL